MKKRLSVESLGRRDLLTANALIYSDGSVEVTFDEQAIVDEVFVDNGFTGPCYIDSHVTFGDGDGGFTVAEHANKDTALFFAHPTPVSVGQAWSPPFDLDCGDDALKYGTNVFMEVRYANGESDFVDVGLATPTIVNGHINIDGSIQLSLSRDVHVTALNLRTLDETLGLSNYQEQGFDLDGSAHPANVIIRSSEPDGVAVTQEWVSPITYDGPLELMVFGGVAGEITLATGEVVEFNVELGPDIPIEPPEIIPPDLGSPEINSPDVGSCADPNPVAAVYPSGLIGISDAHCFPLRGIELISADNGLRTLAEDEFLGFQFQLTNDTDHIAIGSLVDVMAPSFFPATVYHSALEDLRVLIGVTEQPPMEIPVVYRPDPTDPRFDPPPFVPPRLVPPIDLPVAPSIEHPVDPPEAIGAFQGTRLHVTHDGHLSFTHAVDVTGYSLWSESGRFTVNENHPADAILSDREGYVVLVANPGETFSLEGGQSIGIHYDTTGMSSTADVLSDLRIQASGNDFEPVQLSIEVGPIHPVDVGIAPISTLGYAPTGAVHFRFTEDVAASVDRTDFVFTKDGVDYVPQEIESSLDGDGRTNVLVTLPEGVPAGEVRAKVVGEIFAADGRGYDGDADGAIGGEFDESIMIAPPGDTNLDMKVDFVDFLMISKSYIEDGPHNWEDGDFTGDGVVDFADFLLLAQHFAWELHA